MGTGQVSPLDLCLNLRRPTLYSQMNRVVFASPDEEPFFFCLMNYYLDTKVSSLEWMYMALLLFGFDLARIAGVDIVPVPCRH